MEAQNDVTVFVTSIFVFFLQMLMSVRPFLVCVSEGHASTLWGPIGVSVKLDSSETLPQMLAKVKLRTGSLI